MPITWLTDEAPEGGVYPLSVTWKDEAGATVVPGSAFWRLTDSDGVVINSRSNVAITGLATQNWVVLEGDDLAVAGDNNVREILFTYTFTSTIGTVTQKIAKRFTIARTATI